MQKIKIKNRIFLVMLVFAFGIIFSGNKALAYDTNLNVVPSDGDPDWRSISAKDVKVTVTRDSALYAGFLFLDYRAPRNTYELIAGYTDPWTNVWVPPVMQPSVPSSCMPPTTDPNGLVLSPNPTAGFCNAMSLCNGGANAYCADANACALVDICTKSVAEDYNDKIMAAQDQALKDLVTAAGLTSSAGDGVIIKCKENLTCINSILSALSGSGDFVKGDNSSNTSIGSLTLAEMQNLITTSTSTPIDPAINEPDAGALNSADNQGSSKNKVSGPQVDVNFTADKFIPGSTVTATAVPGFFNNNSNPDNLYFTWYLKREGCENKKDVSSNAELKEKCDFDGDNEITENDWKIAAAQILVRGSYDPNGLNYSGTGNASSSGSEAFPKVNDWDSEHVNDVPNCYVKESLSGFNYELRDTDSTFDKACKDGYVRACVKDSAPISCDVVNPAASTISKIITPCVSSWSTLSGGNNQECQLFDNTRDSLANFKTKTVCKNGEHAICEKVENGVVVDTVFPAVFSNSVPIKGSIFANIPSDKDKFCGLIFKPNAVTQVNKPKYIEEKNAAYSLYDTTGCSATVEKITDKTKGDISLKPLCGFVKAKNICKHLFPNAKITGETLGDGKFNEAERKFWGTNLDPKIISTNGSGKRDEEVLTGLGVTNFKWMYSPGDQVGVVVEGDSALSSDHMDSSYMRMWAFSKGACKDLETIKVSQERGIKKGFYTEGTGAAKRGFLVTSFDVDSCLEENLLDPTDNDTSKLTINLTSAPANPINDENGKGDILNVSVSESNAASANGLTYTWSVQESNNTPIDNTVWKDITGDITSTPNSIDSSSSITRSFSENELSGLGKKNLAINLNIIKSVLEKGVGDLGSSFYLRIKVKARASILDGNQETEGAIIVRVRRQVNSMQVYQVDATSSAVLSLDPHPICVDDQGRQQETCYVTKNELLGISVDSIDDTNSNSNNTKFTWSVNDEDMICNPNNDCNGGKNFFFPVLGEEGEAVDVSVSGIGANGEIIEIYRHFVIVGDGLQLISKDTTPYICDQQCLDDVNINACPKYLGKYNVLTTGANDGEVADCSMEVWQTNNGKKVTFGVMAGNITGLNWAIDGQIMTEYADSNEIAFDIEKMPGESYNIEVSTYLTADDKVRANNKRKALLKYWGISQEDVVEEDQRSSIQLDVIAGNVVAKKKSNIFSASLITHLPQQLIFLLKISLTSILLLFVTGVLFAFIPESIFSKENKLS